VNNYYFAVLMPKKLQVIKKMKLNDLVQCGPTTGPRDACGPPQRYQWPAEAFRKNIQI